MYLLLPKWELEIYLNNNLRNFKAHSGSRKKSRGPSETSAGSIKVSYKKKSGKSTLNTSGNKKRLYLHKDRFSKDQLNVQYSPANIENFK